MTCKHGETSCVCSQCDIETIERHSGKSPASPAGSISWSSKPPTEKGMYLWRQSPGTMLTIVYTMKRPDGIMIGKAYGHGERHFYEACPVDVWHGEWLGPLPQQ